MQTDENITNICQRIRQLRVEHAGARGKASFARQLNISPSTYDYYENSRIPPADVLVRIADITGADLRWLITGEEGASRVPSDHPAVQRAAQLLAKHPDAAGPLAAFLDVLARTFEFPAKEPTAAAAPAPSAAAEAPTPAAESPAAQAASKIPAPPAPGGNRQERQGWIPILGRSAAGVPYFWHATGGGDAGATHLRDLVATLRPRPARHIRKAEAVGELGGDEPAVQLVLLDAPESPGTAEFVVAEHISRKYDPVFAVRIDGRSMEPDICHGDVVVLSPNVPAEQGKPALVQLADQIGVTCKLYRKDELGVHLIPINDQFPPQTFPKKQVVWALKVLAHIRPI